MCDSPLKSCVIQTIQMERLNNGSKQMTCSCLIFERWLPWLGSASVEKLQMKLKLFANSRTYFPACYRMHPKMLCCFGSLRPYRFFLVTPPTEGCLHAFLEKYSVHTQVDPGTVLFAYWVVLQRSVG